MLKYSKFIATFQQNKTISSMISWIPILPIISIFTGCQLLLQDDCVILHHHMSCQSKDVRKQNGGLSCSEWSRNSWRHKSSVFIMYQFLKENIHAINNTNTFYFIISASARIQIYRKQHDCQTCPWIGYSVIGGRNRNNRRNHWPVASHLQTLLYNVLSSSGDRRWLNDICKFNCHTVTTATALVPQLDEHKMKKRC